MIKTGQRDEFGGGRKFVFHNTAIQPKGAFHVFSGHVNPNTVTRNNIFDCPGRLTSSRPVDIPCDFDYDLFTGMDRGILTVSSFILRPQPPGSSGARFRCSGAAGRLP
jgi:hypothetical protein